MLIGGRLRAVREEKRLSQGDIEARTGLLRCYISRVENGHTTPAVETLEKFARALEVPLYQLFYEGNDVPQHATSPRDITDDGGWGSSGKDARFLVRMRRVLARTSERDRTLLFSIAQRMVKRRHPRANALEH